MSVIPIPSNSMLNEKVHLSSVEVYKEYPGESGEIPQTDICEYAKRIGIDLEKEPYLKYLAEEGLLRPLPPDWKPCEDKTKHSIFYYNTTSKKSQWEHPLDENYRKEVLKVRQDLAMHRIQEVDLMTRKPPKSLPPLKKLGSSRPPSAGGGGLGKLGPIGGSSTTSGPLINNRTLKPLPLSHDSLSSTANGGDTHDLHGMATDGLPTPSSRTIKKPFGSGLLLTEEERRLLSDINVPLSTIKPGVKFQLDENAEIKFEISTDDNDSEGEKGSHSEDSEADDSGSSTSQDDSDGVPIVPNPPKQSGVPNPNPPKQSGVPNPNPPKQSQIITNAKSENMSGLGGAGESVKITVPETKLEDEKTVLRDSMEKKLKEYESKFEVERSKLQNDIKKHLDMKLEEIRKEKESLIERARQDETTILKDSMEKRLKEHESKLKEERSKLEHEIKKHLDIKLEEIRTEKESLVEKARQDFDNQRNMELDKVKGELESMIQQEVEKLKIFVGGLVENNNDRLANALKSLEMLTTQMLEIKNDRDSKSPTDPSKLAKKSKVLMVKKKTPSFQPKPTTPMKKNISTSTPTTARLPSARPSRSTSEITGLMENQNHDSSSEGSDIVKEAKEFIRTQKERLNINDSNKGSSKFERSISTAPPAWSNNNTANFPKYIVNDPPGSPLKYSLIGGQISVSSPKQSDMFSETESSGVGSLRDFKSHEKKQISKEIESICSSLSNLDEQMRMMWTVVQGDSNKQPINNTLTGTSTTRKYSGGTTVKVRPVTASGDLQYACTSCLSQNNRALLDSLKSTNSLQQPRVSPSNLLNSLDKELKEFKAAKERILNQFTTQVQTQRNTQASATSDENIQDKTKELREWLEKF